MRIIGGRWRGHALSAPKGRGTRPTTDMVREALFSALFDVEGFVVLDLFAGTGAVGLEALSRGAQRVVFVESARPALACLDKNLAAVGAEADRVTVLRTPVARALTQLLQDDLRFDLVFADPPYDEAPRALPDVLAAARDLLADEGRLVCEHRSRDPAPEPLDGLEKSKTKRYGEAALAFYERSEV